MVLGKVLGLLLMCLLTCAPFTSGPHVDAYHPWPMSQISAIYGTDNDSEILNSLYLIANVSAPSAPSTPNAYNEL